jgi:hypothetical protein
MEFALNNEQKRTILLGAKDSATNELYSLLVRIGVDPDLFESIDEIPQDDISIYGERARAQKLIDSISLINSKLEELGV